MELREAFNTISVWESRGFGFHWTSCGIYNQGLITTAKSKDDPTRECTCGIEEAIKVIKASNTWKWLQRV